jgi:hypothetical protein
MNLIIYLVVTFPRYIVLLLHILLSIDLLIIKKHWHSLYFILNLDIKGIYPARRGELITFVQLFLIVFNISIK